MKLVIELSPANKARIDTLVQEGQYASLEQFLDVSLVNQLALEEGKPLPEARTVVPRSMSPLLVVPVHQDPSGFRPAPAPVQQPLTTYAARVFPVKVVLRFLLNICVRDQVKEVRTTVIGRGLLLAATALRNALAQSDEFHQRPRGNQLRIGLPDPDAKSLLRFQVYYLVGRPTASPPVLSLPAQLGFLCVTLDDKTGEPLVALTSSGVEFAQLRNPILDDLKTAESAFTVDETRFLLHQLKSRASVDVDLMRFVLNQTAKRTIERSELLRLFHHQATELVPNARTDAVINGYLSAVASRLTELNLISLRKNGRRTQYAIGPQYALFKEVIG